MKTITGNFNGTGADLYLCIGFIPDWVKVWNLEGTQQILLDWNIQMMRTADVSEGLQFTAADVTAAACTAGGGVIPYYGGTLLTSTLAGTVTYGEGVFLKRDDKDYRYGGDDGDATSEDIDTWTLYSAYTGHFNEDITGTYIGEGSEIVIDGKRYMIQVCAGAAGETDGEVTLSHTGVPSGNVEYIGGMYKYKPMIAGEVAKDGFLLANTTINVDDAICGFAAGTWSQ